MFDKKAQSFLEELLVTPSPTGYEGKGQAVWRSYVSDYADKVESDAYGSASAKIETNPDVFLVDESLISEDRGGYMEPVYTGLDKNRFALSGQISFNHKEPNELSSLELLFSRQLANFTELWVSFAAKTTTGKYEAFAEEISVDAPAEEAALAQSNQSLTTFGLGAGYRFRALGRILKNDRFFESVDTFLTYHLHLDGSSDTNFQGFGLQADYGLHYRAAESFYYGIKFSYNLASLRRAARQEGESLQDRSMVFAWLSSGIELGYYY